MCACARECVCACVRVCVCVRACICFLRVCGSNSAPKPDRFSGISSPVLFPLPNNSVREAITRLALPPAPTLTPSPTPAAEALASEPASSPSATTTATTPTPQEDPI